MKLKYSLLLASLLAAPTSLFAADLSYSYLEGGYNHMNFDEDDSFDSDDSLSGFGLRASGAVTDHWHIFGAYQNADEDSLDFTNWRLGLGYNTPLNDTVDFVGRLAYEHYGLEVDFACTPGVMCHAEDDASGWSLEGGFRGSLTENFEGSIGLRYTDINLDDDAGDDDDINHTSLLLGGQWKFNETWGLSADLDFNQDFTGFFIGPRATF